MVANSEILADKERFDALWDRCLLTGVSCESTPAWQHLLRQYSAPDRYYHNQNHIAHCLSQFDSTAHFIRDKDAVELAIWFHDIILEPAELDNEERSAILFKTLATGCLTRELISKVYEFILATAHRHPPRNSDESFLLDIDLSSLGSRWEQFLDNTSALLKESANSTDEEMSGKNLKFLTQLLDKKRIFLTEFFHARYEARARKNIQRYIAQLKVEGFI